MLRSCQGQSDFSWKPISLQPAILLSTAAFAALLVAVLEYLSRMSDLNGGIYLSNEGFPSYITFVNLYLPTIVAVLFGMVWSWIDLDARRLEPFFQLSRSSGARAEDSLSLHYPFDYVAWASYKAFKKRHWSVVLASSAMMVVFWVVTPLLSAVIETKTIIQDRNATMTSSKTLAPLQDQVYSLTTGFMMTAYSALWLGQPLPGFVTNDVAMLPFTTEASDTPSLSNATWSSTTTAYSTSLHCEPARINGNGSEVSYSNGKGCATDPGALVFDVSQNFTALYIGWPESQFNDYALSRMGCSSSEFLHTFLAFWGTLETGKPHVTALFCEPAYATQVVNATVSATNQSVIDVQPVSMRNSSDLDTLNTTNFEYVISAGSPEISRRADLPDTLGVLDQGLRLQKMGISPNATITNMVGYALGATQFPLTQYMDEDVLASAFEKAHRILFALAVQSLLFPTDASTSTPRKGVMRGNVNSVAVNRGFALATEVSLGLVVCLALGLMTINWRRTIKSRSDPSTIGHHLALLGVAGSSLQRIDPNELVELDKGKLKRVNSQQAETDVAVEHHKGRASLCNGDSRSNRESQNKAATKRPAEIRLSTGLAFLTVLILATATLIAVQVQIDGHVGLPVPSTNAVVYQLITNYIPVLFATFLEPFWTLLNRILCMLKPFDALQTGEMRPSKTIYLKYSSLPPPLIILRAFRAQHLLLVAVCAIGVSTNVLTVALGGLFQTNSVTLVSDATFEYPYQPLLRTSHPDTPDVFSPEPFYVASSNITNGVPLPPWTSDSTFFLPFRSIDRSNVTVPQATFRAATIGFGARLTCSEVPQDTKAYVTQRKSDTDAPPWNASIGDGRNCADPLYRPYGGQNRSESALEVFHGLTSTANHNSSSDEYCATTFMAAFLRGNLTVSSDDFKTDNSATVWRSQEISAVNALSATWLICQAKFLAAPYDVTVDGEGHIQDAVRHGDYVADVQPFFADGLNETMFINNTRQLWNLDELAWWHNDTFVDSWLGYFVKTLSNSTEFIDPTSPVPTFDAIAPLIEDLYSRVFAIMLALNTDWLEPAATNMTSPGSVLTVQDRVFTSPPAFVIAVTLLSLNIVVALLYYWKRPSKMLRRMPTTIASVLELFDGSGLILEASKTSGGPSDDTPRLPEDMKLGYGRFVGTDGKPHTGIERRPFVIPWGQSKSA